LPNGGFITIRSKPSSYSSGSRARKSPWTTRRESPLLAQEGGSVGVDLDAVHHAAAPGDLGGQGAGAGRGLQDRRPGVDPGRVADLHDQAGRGREPALLVAGRVLAGRQAVPDELLDPAWEDMSADRVAAIPPAAHLLEDAVHLLVRGAVEFEGDAHDVVADLGAGVGEDGQHVGRESHGASGVG
jgi:hypothetical protein